MELSDLIEAIPRLQTVLNFGTGFLAGAFTRYKISSSYLAPGVTAASGYFIVAQSFGSSPDYAADIVSALAGSYLGAVFVSKREARKKDEHIFKNILRGVRSAEEIVNKSQGNNLH